MGVSCQRHAPAALPPGKTRYALYRRLGGPQGRSGRARKISPPPGFDPWIVQPVASRYTDWAIPALTQVQVVIQWQAQYHNQHRKTTDNVDTVLFQTGLCVNVQHKV